MRPQDQNVTAMRQPLPSIDASTPPCVLMSMLQEAYARAFAHEHLLRAMQQDADENRRRIVVLERAVFGEGRP